jgi:hypothetical protein
MVSKLLLIAFLTLIKGCSYEAPEIVVRKIPKKRVVTYDNIKADVERYCVKCHDGKIHPLDLGDEEIFRSSRSKLRIENGTMPPDGILPEDVKALILAYFGS